MSVSARSILLVTAACLGLTLLTAWLFKWSFEKAAFLAPVIVVAVGALAGVVLLWARVAWESIRHRDHPGRIVALAVGALVVIAGLSLLGLKLPRE